jgi:serine phosphatase RsbU (regulator of sigma subunit)
LIRENGSSQLLETEGGLLGVFADETYSQIEVELNVDDTLLLYSDGFEQAFPAEESTTLHGRKTPTLRYRDEFLRLAALRVPELMIQHIGRRLDDQCGSLHQLDDLTLICMRAAAFPQPHAHESEFHREHASVA